MIFYEKGFCGLVMFHTSIIMFLKVLHWKAYIIIFKLVLYLYLVKDIFPHKLNIPFHENIISQDVHCYALFLGNMKNIVSQRVLNYIYFDKVYSKPASCVKTICIFYFIPKFLRIFNSEFFGRTEMKATFWFHKWLKPPVLDHWLVTSTGS